MKLLLLDVSFLLFELNDGLDLNEINTIQNVFNSWINAKYLISYW